MVGLAAAYEIGKPRGVKRDMKKALRLLRRAADLDHAIAQATLAGKFLEGLDVFSPAHRRRILRPRHARGPQVPRNYAEAARLYTLAAEQGLTLAESLRRCLFSSRGARPDSRRRLQV